MSKLVNAYNYLEREEEQLPGLESDIAPFKGVENHSLKDNWAIPGLATVEHRIKRTPETKWN